MGGRRTTKQDIEQIEALTSEGLTTREIAARLNRTEASIRNLRYKKNLSIRIKDETKALFQQKDELANKVKNLQEQINALVFVLENLRAEKAKLETAITTAKNYPQEILAQKLISLKWQRPDLFTLSDAEQLAMLVKEFLR